jgi:hypothetical protein
MFSLAWYGTFLNFVNNVGLVQPEAICPLEQDPRWNKPVPYLPLIIVPSFRDRKNGISKKDKPSVVEVML